MSFSWTCPFCNHSATIQSENESHGAHLFNCDNKSDHQMLRSHVICCPNEDCREYSLSIALHDATPGIRGTYITQGAKETWQLIPQSKAKVFPDYVPSAIIDDYKEACAIKELSPKASATLSRRCLQGMIRDFWNVSKNNLYEEIEAIKDRVDPMTWKAIDAVRKVGNIGAHMEKDIDLIIEVEQEEASSMIQLIEILINDWYITREERRKNMEKIVEVSEQKQEARRPSEEG